MISSTFFFERVRGVFAGYDFAHYMHDREK